MQAWVNESGCQLLFELPGCSSPTLGHMKLDLRDSSPEEERQHGDVEEYLPAK